MNGSGKFSLVDKISLSHLYVSKSLLLFYRYFAVFELEILFSLNKSITSCKGVIISSSVKYTPFKDMPPLCPLIFLFEYVALIVGIITNNFNDFFQLLYDVHQLTHTDIPQDNMQ